MFFLASNKYILPIFKNIRRSIVYSNNLRHNLIETIDSNNFFDTLKQNLYEIDANHNYLLNTNKTLDSKSYFKQTILNDLKYFSANFNPEKKLLINKIRELDFSNLYNEYNYVKHPIEEYDLFTAYLIIWGNNAKTPIHFHSSYGCCILNLNGLWLENIYYKNGDKKNTNIFKSNTVSYIDNEIGSHEIKYLNLYPGVSVNIYSPSKELQ